ncbi:MAG TPA: DeoR/GlpR transcriptional regulator [Clostridiaceae bacterium]|nr:DeoR/GlpR transcriptional regulator [Clostridiaceae bacterium]
MNNSIAKNKRQSKIINILKEEEIVSVTSLAERLHYSEMTIRRDLKYFETNGLVLRFHGGATYLKPDYILPSFDERIGRNRAEKRKIARAAVKYITIDSIVCFDGGTTALAIVNFIPDHLQFTAISTGLIASSVLSQKQNCSVIQVGGTIDNLSKTVFDSTSENFIRNFTADIAFICCRAIDVTRGTFEANITYSNEKNALSNISATTIVVADYTKFNHTSLCLGLPINEIDILITDDKTPSHIIKSLNNQGIETIIAT